MRRSSHRLQVMSVVGLVVLMITVAGAQPASSPNTLSADERAGGWALLFDGTSLAGWRAFRTTTPPAVWKVTDGTLTLSGPGGDLMTSEEYRELRAAARMEDLSRW